MDFFECVAVGSSVLLASAILKMTPDYWFEKMPVSLDENESLGKDTCLNRVFQQNVLQKRVVSTEFIEYQDQEHSTPSDERDDDFIRTH